MGSWVGLVALGQFPYPLGIVGSFMCVRFVPERPVCCRVRSLCVRSIPELSGGRRVCLVVSIPVRPAGRRVLSGVFGPFPCTLGVIGCVQSIHVHPGGRRVRWCVFGPFPYALGVIWFFRVRSVHSRSP